MGYYDQTDSHDSPAANAFDIGTLSFCLYSMNKCWPQCGSRREKWGNESWWLVRAPRWQGHFYFYFLLCFKVCFGTLWALLWGGAWSVSWSVRFSGFESSGASAWPLCWPQGERGSLESEISGRSSSRFCGHWCEDVSRPYLSMSKGKLGPWTAVCHFPWGPENSQSLTEEIQMCYEKNFTVESGIGIWSHVDWLLLHQWAVVFKNCNGRDESYLEVCNHI